MTVTVTFRNKVYHIHAEVSEHTDKYTVVKVYGKNGMILKYDHSLYKAPAHWVAVERKIDLPDGKEKQDLYAQLLTGLREQLEELYPELKGLRDKPYEW